MIKRWVCLFFGGIVLAASLAAHSQADEFETEARHAILIDVTNNSVLYAKNENATFAPASLAKLMTLAVVFDAIKQGKLADTDIFKMSEHAWRTGGAPSRTTTMFARVNSDVTVRDLMRGVAIVVANDGAMALAEGIAGGEKPFAERMNAMAKQLGLKSSVFVNSTGLPEEGQKTSVRDMARIAQYLITEHPDLYSIFNEPELNFGGIRQTNRNPMRAQFSGTDGLMIGSIVGEGHMIAVSAQRDGKRLLAVLAGLADDKVRLRATSALLDLGFNGYIDRSLFEANDVVTSARVYGGTRSSVELIAAEAVSLSVPKNAGGRIIARAVYQGPVLAPVKRGTQIGVLRIWRNDLLQREVPLLANEDVAEGTLLSRAMDAGYEFFAGKLYSLGAKLIPRV